MIERGADSPWGATRESARLSPAIVVIGAVTGIGLRLWLAAGHHGNYDEDSFQAVAGIVARGGNVYSETFRYNYSPIWANVLGLLAWAAAKTGASLHLVFRGFLSAVDLAVAALLGGIARRASGGAAGSFSRAFLAYLLNPVAILIVGFHGQFDNLAALPLLLAVLLLLGSESRPRRGRIVALWALATAALLVKHLNVFEVWTFLLCLFGSVRRGTLALAAGVGVFLLSFVPYLPGGGEGIVRNVFLYRGMPHPYGLTTWLPPAVVFPLFLVVMAALTVAAWRRRPLPAAMAASAVGTLLFIPGITEAYFIHPIIWGSVRRGPGYWVFSLATYFFLLSGPGNLQVWSGFLPWNLPWLSLCFWGLLLLGGRLRPPTSLWPSRASLAQASPR